MSFESQAPTEKAQENRLRRTADRRGLRLVKSRRRFSDADDFGAYMLVDLLTDAVVEGANDLGRPVWTLDDVQRFFDEGGRR